MALKIFLTGATGYIGKNLAQALHDHGFEVAIFTRKSSDIRVLQKYSSKSAIFLLDGTTENIIKSLQSFKPDVIVHLASLFLAEHKTEDAISLINSNITFPTQLLEAVSHCDIKYFLNTGTSWQHYQNKIYSPVNLYAATKQAFEDLLQYYVEVCGLRAYTLELFDSYGPDDDRGKLISKVIYNINNNIPLDLSPGDQKVDLVHIDDVVSAYLIAIDQLLLEKSSTHKKFGISSGHPVTLKNLILELIGLMGSSTSPNWGARSYRKREVMLPWDRFSPLPNWQPVVSLRDGLSRLIKSGAINE